MKPTKAVFSSPVIGRKPSRRAPARCCAVILMLVASVCSADSIRDAEEMTARFLRGNRRTFNSKGHPKSLGMEIEFQYPSDWRCSEGVRPHVVVSVASDDPIAPLCHLQIVDFAESFARELQVPASEIRKQLRR